LKPKQMMLRSSKQAVQSSKHHKAVLERLRSVETDDSSKQS
jgi:hypothetical protein